MAKMSFDTAENENSQNHLAFSWLKVFNTMKLWPKLVFLIFPTYENSKATQTNDGGLSKSCSVFWMTMLGNLINVIMTLSSGNSICLSPKIETNDTIRFPRCLKNLMQDWKNDISIGKTWRCGGILIAEPSGRSSGRFFKVQKWVWLPHKSKNIRSFQSFLTIKAPNEDIEFIITAMRQNWKLPPAGVCLSGTWWL